jgi:hypothetical protein
MAWTVGTIALLPAQAVGLAAVPFQHLAASASLLLIRDYRPMSRPRRSQKTRRKTIAAVEADFVFASLD